MERMIPHPPVDHNFPLVLEANRRSNMKPSPGNVGKGKVLINTKDLQRLIRQDDEEIVCVGHDEVSRRSTKLDDAILIKRIYGMARPLKESGRGDVPNMDRLGIRRVIRMANKRIDFNEIRLPWYLWSEFQ
jgi:hypothetical protein